MKALRVRFLFSVVALGLATSVPAVDKVRISDQGNIQKDWTPVANAPLVQPAYPPSMADRSLDVCVSLGYQINKDGTTSDFGVLRAWSSATPEVDASLDALSPFIQSAAAAVSMWKYQATPTAAANRVVYTSASIPFVGLKGTPVDEVRARCDISDLREFIAQAQQKAYRRGNANKAALDSYQRSNTPQRQVESAAARRNGGSGK